MLILEVECEMESGEMLDEPEVALVCRRSKSSANEVINKTEHPAHERGRGTRGISSFSLVASHLAHGGCISVAELATQ